MHGKYNFNPDRSSCFILMFLYKNYPIYTYILVQTCDNLRLLVNEHLPSSLPPSRVDIGPRIRRGVLKTNGKRLIFWGTFRDPPTKVTSFW